MASLDTNDNGAAAHGPDAHGHAALLLVESLIHGMLERRLITVADAVEIVEVAAEVKVDGAADLGDSPANLRKSLSLLTAISSSLARDRA